MPLKSAIKPPCFTASTDQPSEAVVKAIVNIDTKLTIPTQPFSDADADVDPSTEQTQSVTTYTNSVAVDSDDNRYFAYLVTKPTLVVGPDSEPVLVSQTNFILLKYGSGCEGLIWAKYEAATFTTDPQNFVSVGVTIDINDNPVVYYPTSANNYAVEVLDKKCGSVISQAFISASSIIITGIAASKTSGDIFITGLNRAQITVEFDNEFTVVPALANQITAFILKLHFETDLNTVSGGALGSVSPFVNSGEFDAFVADHKVFVATSSSGLVGVTGIFLGPNFSVRDFTGIVSQPTTCTLTNEFTTPAAFVLTYTEALKLNSCQKIQVTSQNGSATINFDVRSIGFNWDNTMIVVVNYRTQGWIRIKIYDTTGGVREANTGSNGGLIIEYWPNSYINIASFSVTDGDAFYPMGLGFQTPRVVYDGAKQKPASKYDFLSSKCAPNGNDSNKNNIGYAVIGSFTGKLTYGNNTIFAPSNAPSGFVIWINGCNSVLSLVNADYDKCGCDTRNAILAAYTNSVGITSNAELVAGGSFKVFKRNGQLIFLTRIFAMIIVLGVCGKQSASKLCAK